MEIHVYSGSQEESNEISKSSPGPIILFSTTTPADVYFGRREEIIKRRKEQKQATLERRFQYNLDQASNLTRDGLGNEL